MAFSEALLDFGVCALDVGSCSEPPHVGCYITRQFHHAIEAARRQIPQGMRAEPVQPAEIDKCYLSIQFQVDVARKLK